MDKRLYIAETPYKRLDTFLSEQTDEFTRSRLKKLIESGQVCVDGVTQTKAGADVKAGGVVELTVPDAVEYTAKPENIPVDIVYQDEDFAVVNKPKGMTVHIGNGVLEGTLVNALLYQLNSLSGIGGVLRPGIVHRIDKDTTGLLVVAKNDKAHVSLASQIAEKTCKRTYYALLEGNLKEERGKITTDIGRSLSDRTKMSVLPMGKGKVAITEYETVAHFGEDFTLCKFNLQTGRTHQIRVHARYLNHPVAGDPVYGFKKQKLAADGQLLHAQRLELTHPTSGKRMCFTAPLPQAFRDILKKLCNRYGVDCAPFAEIMDGYVENNQSKTE